MTNAPAAPRRRGQRLTTTTTTALLLAAAAAASLPSGADAFAAPSSVARTSVRAPASSSSRRSSLAAAPPSRSGGIDERENPSFDLGEFSRPIFAAATSGFLAASLLLSPPLLPPPEAGAVDLVAPASAAPVLSRTATSVDIDLKSLPSLTRRVIVNRDKLTNYLIESIKSFKPILEILSESDTVTVRPPKDVKGAINEALTKGEAEFLVNGESVDVRVESVPGVVIVRVTNPRIPRLPFLKDGSASLKFVNEIVDVAPEGIEKAAEEVQAIEKFLMWGAPTKPPIQYEGSSLDYFLSSKSLGVADLTNGETVFAGITVAVVASYGVSYSYYVSLQEAAERAEREKKDKVAAKKKAKAAAEAEKKKAAKEKADAEAKAADAEAAVKAEGKKKEEEIESVASAYDSVAAGAGGEANEAGGEGPDGARGGKRGRKRDAFKKLFGRGKKE